MFMQCDDVNPMTDRGNYWDVVSAVIDALILFCSHT